MYTEEQLAELKRFADERKRQFQFVRDAQVQAGITEPFDSWGVRGLSEKAAEIFIHFLNDSRITDENIRDGMARNLGVEAAYKYFDQLVEFYLQEPSSKHESLSLGVKEGFARAIVDLSRLHPEKLDVIFQLASQESNGLTRVIFLAALKKSKRENDHSLIRQVALESPDLRDWLRNPDWKSYWKKNDPALFTEWYSAPKKRNKS